VRDPKISILLVVKNAMPLVTGALDSLKQQTFKDFEIVVADGASTDGTLEVLREAAKELPLRILSEQDRSLADGTAKGLPHLSADIVGLLGADERYYRNTLAQVLRWFEAEPNAVMCGGKVDFIDEHNNVVDSHLTDPFNLSAHLACEQVPSILSSFFNRRLISENLRFDAVVPTCPDYEFWGRLGFRFPPSAFKRYHASVAQAYRTRDSMSFRAESFTRFCRDKITHLNNLIDKEFAQDAELLRRRSSAGIHMWAAEQLSGIEPGHSDILAHCAAAALYDPLYERIGRFIATTSKARYDAATGAVTRTVHDQPGSQAVVVAALDYTPPPSHWSGAAVTAGEPLTVRTADTPWGFSAKVAVADQNAVRRANGEQYWVRIDLEVAEGRVGVSLFASEQKLIGELIFRKGDGRSLALIPLPTDMDPAMPVMLRSGGHASSVLHIYRAELLCDQDRGFARVEPIALWQ
jgi:glycosyltransferase involved in cell wall biosynthesis